MQIIAYVCVVLKKQQQSNIMFTLEKPIVKLSELQPVNIGHDEMTHDYESAGVESFTYDTELEFEPIGDGMVLRADIHYKESMTCGDPNDDGELTISNITAFDIDGNEVELSKSETGKAELLIENAINI